MSSPVVKLSWFCWSCNSRGRLLPPLRWRLCDTRLCVWLCVVTVAKSSCGVKTLFGPARPTMVASMSVVSFLKVLSWFFDVIYVALGETRNPGSGGGDAAVSSPSWRRNLGVHGQSYAASSLCGDSLMLESSRDFKSCPFFLNVVLLEIIWSSVVVLQHPYILS